MTTVDLKAVNEGIPHLAPPECTTTEPPAGDSQGINQSIYVVGDSIMQATQKALEDKLASADYAPDSILINADQSRSIDSPGGDGGTSGLEALDTDKDFITNATKIVVQLGTNGGDTDENIKKFIKKLKSYNNSADLYWVNVGVSRADLYQEMRKANQNLDSGSSDNGYKVIDWYKKIDKDDANNLLADKVHPNAQGQESLSKLIIDSLGVATAPTSQPSSAYAKKNNRTAKAYSLLLGKGLTEVQVAGVLGNLIWESGNENIDPRYDDGHNIGIASWIDSRRAALIKYAEKNDKSKYNLSIQVDYLWSELTGDPANGLKELKNATDVETATEVFLEKFERAGDPRQAERTEYARKVLKELAGIEASSSDKEKEKAKDPKNCKCSESTEPSTGDKPIVFLDPGHGATNEVVDPKTGVRDIESDNGKETDDVWDVANIAKKDLEKLGYEVAMSKDKVREKSSFREKANKANKSNAVIGISIHTDAVVNEIYYQKVGLYRQSGSNKSVFNNEEVAKKSIDYANTFKDVRKEVENVSADVIVHGDYSDGRDLAAGNIALIMLWSDVPWVYLEKKQDGGGSLSGSSKKEYAKSIVEGVKKTNPISDDNTVDANASSSSAQSKSTAKAIPSEAEFIKKFGKNKGVAWAEAGGKPTEYGSASSMKAWSTSKPLVVAAYLELKGSPGDQDGNITKALNTSDNDAILAVFNAGGAGAMNEAMTKILRKAGDNDTKISTSKGDGITTFGQTIWSLENQVKFMSALSEGKVVDKKSSDYILKKMKDPIQKWGLGTIGASAYKPGWGGTVNRQMGIVPGPSGKDYAVAIGQSDSGGNENPENVKGNDELAKWLQENVFGKDSGDTSSGCNDDENSVGNGDVIPTILEYTWHEYYPKDVGKANIPNDAYKKANAAAKKKGEYVGGCNGQDCGAFVTRAMRDSGADKKFNKNEGNTVFQKQYMDDHPELYEKLGVDVPSTKLQPGDIANNGPGHTYFYIGKQKGVEKYNSASASLCGRFPMVSDMDPGSGYSWYRKK